MSDISTDEVSPDVATAHRAPRVYHPPLEARGGRPMAIIPQDVEQAYRQAQFAVAGGFAPRGWNVNQAVSAIMMGAEMGIRPMMSLQTICVINGRPSVWGAAVPGIAMGTGQLEDWEESLNGEGDQMTATCRVNRRGFKTPVVRLFSVADAKQAGLWDKAGPWKQYPKRMLQMRARVAFRDAFADAFSGLYLAEEAQDMRDVTPQHETIHNPLQDDADVDERPARDVPAERGLAVRLGGIVFLIHRQITRG